MDVVETMATDAVGRHRLGPGVTESATDGAVRTPKGELRPVVVEGRVGPPGRGVTIGAVTPQRAVMHVVLAMTRGAIVGRVAVTPPGRVTGSAGRRGVSAGQRIVGLVVVEDLRQEPDHVRIASTVLRVASSTCLGGANRLRMPVEAEALRQIRALFFVAAEAELVLGSAVERAVALAALSLPALVSRDHGPRHQEPIEIECASVSSGRDHRRPNEQEPPPSSHLAAQYR